MCRSPESLRDVRGVSTTRRTRVEDALLQQTLSHILAKGCLHQDIATIDGCIRPLSTEKVFSVRLMLCRSPHRICRGRKHPAPLPMLIASAAADVLLLCRKQLVLFGTELIQKHCLTWLLRLETETACGSLSSAEGHRKSLKLVAWRHVNYIARQTLGLCQRLRPI